VTRVFLGVGSNLDDRVAHLRAVIDRLRHLAGVEFIDASPLYWTEPWERRPGQAGDEAGWFYNCVVALETSLEPLALLEEIQAIEALEGRVRGPGTPEDQRYEPRTIDIDILLYGERIISGAERLQVPHLLMHERAFVLRPLADLAPHLEHPVLYQTIADLLAALEDEHAVRRADLPDRWFEP
jgi:2-amino-4-hydroxy-6-hydroxymethyldihydropteridine diphosphokinase